MPAGSGEGRSISFWLADGEGKKWWLGGGQEKRIENELRVECRDGSMRGK